ncbi:hypothetical protein KXD40_003651 [Peronospora effusa]|uniref:Uncharacterized protein n=1 Tax=Peronospora effusa TaxID=542832 RepID=A0A3M6VJR5_9STRA|nr:hypothetical protein DD238_003757 [Peronospora effusa]RQM15967.1 hypothetical protein DD237_004243 [Peronospora effusa]UIZ23188.1 hypothetical protein KXD40_003651 [Peronospora effusa]
MTAGIGTAFWIALAVILGKDYDKRSDSFSLGTKIDTEATRDSRSSHDDGRRAHLKLYWELLLTDPKVGEGLLVLEPE